MKPGRTVKVRSLTATLSPYFFVRFFASIIRSSFGHEFELGEGLSTWVAYSLVARRHQRYVGDDLACPGGDTAGPVEEPDRKPAGAHGHGDEPEVQSRLGHERSQRDRYGAQGVEE